MRDILLLELKILQERENLQCLPSLQKRLAIPKQFNLLLCRAATQVQHNLHQNISYFVRDHIVWFYRE